MRFERARLQPCPSAPHETRALAPEGNRISSRTLIYVAAFSPSPPVRHVQGSPTAARDTIGNLRQIAIEKKLAQRKKASAIPLDDTEECRDAIKS